MANNYFSKTGFPSYKAFMTSSSMRSEFALIEDGFDKVSPLTGNDNYFVRVNSGGTAQESVDPTLVPALIGAQELSEKDASGGYCGLTLYNVNLYNDAGTYKSLLANANTAARTYTMKDEDGTIEHTGHTVASHGDTTATGAELNTLTGGSTADPLHTHTTGNLSDTTATGPELNTLTDGSDADALHNHTTGNLSDTTATGANLNTLTDGSNADLLHEHSSAVSITADTTLYIAPSTATPAGNDTTGEGTALLPWYSPEKVFDYLKDKWINTDVAVLISPVGGTYTDLNPVTVNHPCSENISIVGASGDLPTFSFLTDGFSISGVNLKEIKYVICLSQNIASSVGISITDNAFCNLDHVDFNTFSQAFFVENSRIQADNCDVINCTNGLQAYFSSGYMKYTTFGVTLLGAVVRDSSSIDMTNSDVAGGTTGFAALNNSFINATGTTSTATTPYSPAINTEGSVRSYINK